MPIVETTKPSASRAAIQFVGEDWPGVDGKVGVLRIASTSERRPVVWGPVEVAHLHEQVRRIGPGLAALVLLDDGGAFAAGADLADMLLVGEAAAARRVAEDGLAVIEALRSTPSPVISVLTGAARGGGFELVLAGDLIVATEGAGPVALPEVSLGLVPGWGGATAVVRRCGQTVARRFTVDRPAAGKADHTVEEAASIGLVDAVVPIGQWREAAAAALRHGIAPRQHHGEAADEAVRGGGPAESEAHTLIALSPNTSPDVIQSRTADAFAHLLMTDQTRAMIYARRLLGRRDRAHKEPAFSSVRSAGVIGAGLMAGQLATLLLQYGGIPVQLVDVDQVRADAGVRAVRARLDRLAARERLAVSEAEHLKGMVSGTTDIAHLSNADFVVEAVFEDLSVKREVFTRLEREVSPTTLLATNTSSLSIDDIADALIHPGRFFGFHVFNPVSAVRLVELVRGGATNEESMVEAVALADRLGRVPVITADRPGFVVNRLLTRALGTVFDAIDSGADPDAANAALDSLEFPMRPLDLLSFIGPVVQLRIFETLAAHIPSRFRVPAWLQAFVARDGRTVLDSNGAASADLRAVLPPGSSDSGADLVAEVLNALADEAHRMLEEGVVAHPEDIDLCMILGANYPLGNGGLTPLLDRSGASQRAFGGSFHAPGSVSVPTPADEPSVSS